MAEAIRTTLANEIADAFLTLLEAGERPTNDAMRKIVRCNNNALSEHMPKAMAIIAATQRARSVEYNIGDFPVEAIQSLRDFFQKSSNEILKTERDQLTKDRQALETARDNFAQQKLEQSTTIERLKTELRNQVDNHSATEKRLSKEIDQLKNDNEKLAQQVHTLRMEKGQLEGTLQAEKKERQSSEQKCVTLSQSLEQVQNTLDDQTSQLSTVEKELIRKTAECDSTKSQLVEHKRDAAKKEASWLSDTAQLQQELADCKLSLDQMTSRFTSADADAGRYAEVIKEKETEIILLQKEFAETESKNEHLRIQTSVMEDQAKQQTKQMQKLHDHNVSLERINATLQSKLSDQGGLF